MRSYLVERESRLIKGIIFDLGYTLIHFTRDGGEATREGAEAMADWYFKKKRIKLDSAALVETFLAEREAAQLRASQSQTEILARTCLETALDKIEAPAKAKNKTLLDLALRRYFEPLEQACQAYLDAVSTLKQLKNQNYRLGLYSNATDDYLVQRLVNANKLRSELTATLSSAGYGWRKPKPDGLLLIAKRWELSPDTIVMVGDSLEADVLGAQNAGMKSILVTMNGAPTNEAQRHLEPTAMANSLSELPEIIADL